MNYKDYNDYELLNYIEENNETASEIMYKKYEPLVNKIANKMLKFNKNTGIDINDLVQEGMLGLTNAIEYFDNNEESNFYTYAKTCIERQMISFTIKSHRQKRRILNEAISIDTTDEYGNGSNLEYLFKNDTLNPEKILLTEEKIDNMLTKASDVLTDLEYQVFELKISGFDYKEIAELLDKNPKSIDNAIQRIRTKLKDVVNIYST